MKGKQILSLLLSLTLVLVTVTYYAPAPARAANIYTDCAYAQYSAEDPEQMLLFDFGSATHRETDYRYFDGVVLDDGQGASQTATAFAYNGNGRLEDVGLALYTKGNTTNTVGAKVATNWGMDQVMGIQLADKWDYHDTGNDKVGQLDGVSEASTTSYWYFNIEIDFTTPLDLTKFTHWYIPFYVEGYNAIPYDCWLNFVLVDNASNTNLDGFECAYNLNSEYDPSGNGLNSSQVVAMDLRNIAATSGVQNAKLDSIDSVVIRCYSTTSDLRDEAQQTPMFYFGRSWVTNSTDTIEPDVKYTEDTDSSTYAYEPEQASIVTVQGNWSWNREIALTFPIWKDSGRIWITNLDYGDANTTTEDYYFTYLHTWSWRWKPQNMDKTNFSTMKYGRSFPTQPANYQEAGGGAQAIATSLSCKQYLSDTAHASYYF